MAQVDKYTSLEAKFDAAVRVIRSLPEDGPFQPSDDMMLMFYSYYKQATLGPCDIPRPNGFWDSRGKAKWDAWNSLGTMTKEEAMLNYIEDIQLILETIPISDEVSDLVGKLGTFYTEDESGTLEEEQNEVDKRPFTRPFADCSGMWQEVLEPYKPILEGYGGLWEDIQNPTGMPKETSGHDDMTDDRGQEKENSKAERKEESSEWEDEEEEEEDDDTDDEDEEEEEDEQERRRGPDPRLVMEENRRWRSDIRDSSSSVEPSMSSVTNGTHSSLNSEVEEEELACSVEPCAQRTSYRHLNGHLRGHSDVFPEKNHRATDSDNEEFCDSMEHLAMEEGLVQSPGLRAPTVRQKDLWDETKTMMNGGKDLTRLGDPFLEVLSSTGPSTTSLSRRGRGSLSPRVACGSLLSVNVEAACCSVAQSRRSGSVGGVDINEQIAVALLRLQDDMAHVLHRLHTLEVLTVSQSRSPSPRQEDHLSLVRKFQRPSWWPFHFSPVTVVLTTVWPLVAHWLVQLYLQRKRRKIS